jgi:hypothetical protein
VLRRTCKAASQHNGTTADCSKTHEWMQACGKNRCGHGFQRACKAGLGQRTTRDGHEHGAFTGAHRLYLVGELTLASWDTNVGRRIFDAVRPTYHSRPESQSVLPSIRSCRAWLVTIVCPRAHARPLIRRLIRRNSKHETPAGSDSDSAWDRQQIAGGCCYSVPPSG